MDLNILPRKLAERVCEEGWLNTGADSACDISEIRDGEKAATDAIEAVIREAIEKTLEAAEQACEEVERFRSDFDVSRPGIRQAIRSQTNWARNGSKGMSKTKLHSRFPTIDEREGTHVDKSEAEPPISVPAESRPTQEQYRTSAKDVLKAFYASGGIVLPDSDYEREEHLAELEIVEFALQAASSSLLPVQTELQQLADKCPTKTCRIVDGGYRACGDNSCEARIWGHYNTKTDLPVGHQQESSLLETARKWNDERCARYGCDNDNQLQFKWRSPATLPETFNINEAEAALMDAFIRQGGAYVWPGDGSSCAAQIVEAVWNRSRPDIHQIVEERDEALEEVKHLLDVLSRM